MCISPLASLSPGEWEAGLSGETPWLIGISERQRLGSAAFPVRDLSADSQDAGPGLLALEMVENERPTVVWSKPAVAVRCFVQLSLLGWSLEADVFATRWL